MSIEEPLKSQPTNADDESYEWAYNEAPGTRDHGEEAEAIGRRVALAAYKDNQAAHSARLVLTHWNLRCDPEWSGEQLDSFLDHAVATTNAIALSHYPRTPTRWREKLAARRRAQEERKDHAAKVKELAERLGCGIRQAQVIAANGTSDYEIAAVTAKVFGGDVADYLRRKRGRRADTAKWFLARRFEGGDFVDFQRVNVMALSLGPGIESLAVLKARAVLQGQPETVAEALWRDFLRWRVDVLRSIVVGEEDFG
jgi:hypothetical protein